MLEKDPRTFEADMKGLAPEQKAMVKLEITLNQFFKSLDKSILRWERLFYPAMALMAILGLSGFYLIYSVTRDMSTLTQHVDPRMKYNLDAMSSHMAELSKNISVMTKQVGILVQKVDSMDSHIVRMDGNISGIAESIGDVKLSMDNMTHDISTMTGAIMDMNLNIADMDQAMRSMTVSTQYMSRDLNQIGRPLDFFNNFTPW